MKDKIRKLLALANDPGATEGERANASRMAAKFMAKHDIDLSDLQEAELREQFDLISGEAVGCRPGKKNPSEVPTWIGVIAWGIKLYTRTRATSGRGGVYFKGPREDVELAQWLQGILVTSCYTASEGRSQAAASAFRNGYAAVIQSRFKAMVQDRTNADQEATCTALVRVQDVRKQVMDEAYGSEEEGKKSQNRQSQEGAEAGRNAAIPTGRPISQSFLRITQ